MILSAKLFEYLAAGRPILAVVPPDGEAAARRSRGRRRRRRRTRGRGRHRGRARRPGDAAGATGELGAGRALRTTCAAASRAASGPSGWPSSCGGSRDLDRRGPARRAPGRPARPPARARSSSCSSPPRSRSRSRRCGSRSAGAYLFLSDVAAAPLRRRASSRTAPSRRDWSVPRTAAILAGFFALFLAGLPRRLLQPGDAGRPRRVREGPREVGAPLRAPRHAPSPTSAGARRGSTGRRSRSSSRASSRTPPTGSSSSRSRRRPGGTSTSSCSGRSASTSAGGITLYGTVGDAARLPDDRAHARPEPPRRHARAPDPAPPAALPAARARAIRFARRSRSRSPSSRSSS